MSFYKSRCFYVVVPLVISLISLVSYTFFFKQGLNQTIIGRVENVGIDEADTYLKARIDTGAGISSINAKIIDIVKAGSPSEKDRIIFEIIDKDGEAKTLKLPVEEWVNIKSKGSQGTSRRPVVRMDICLGGKKIDARVNLADRSNFIYPVLIGRNLLKTGDFLIDPSKNFTGKPGCK